MSVCAPNFIYSIKKVMVITLGCHSIFFPQRSCQVEKARAAAAPRDKFRFTLGKKEKPAPATAATHASVGVVEVAEHVVGATHSFIGRCDEVRHMHPFASFQVFFFFSFKGFF